MTTGPFAALIRYVAAIVALAGYKDTLEGLRVADLPWIARHSGFQNKLKKDLTRDAAKQEGEFGEALAASFLEQKDKLITSMAGIIMQNLSLVADEAELLLA
jgi:hypothetical protein